LHREANPPTAASLIGQLDRESEMRAREMLKSHRKGGHAAVPLGAAIEACYECAQVCIACADACLAENDVSGLRACIELDLNCADVCAATGAVLTRRTESQPGLAAVLLEACIRACRDCAAECRRHAEMHAHCRYCAETCEACGEACEKAKQATAGSA
jgi:hypothetical protein